MRAAGGLRGTRGLVLTTALALLVVIGGLVAILAREGPVRLGDNGRVGTAVGGFLDPGHHRTCTRLTTVPEGTRTVRMSAFIADAAGKPVPDATVRRGTRATVQPRGGRRVAVPLRADGQNLSVDLPSGTARAGTRLCLRQSRQAAYAVSIRGVGPDPLARDAAFGVIYEQGQSRSWFARAGDIADHVPVARPAHQGGWTLWVGLALMALAALGGLAAALGALAGRLGHGRRAVVVVALVAVCSSGSWAFLSPPLQTPDAESHLSYVSYLAHHGRPPASTKPEVSSALAATQAYTREGSVRLVSEGRPPFTQQAAGPRPSSGVPDDDGGVVQNARNNPILYYAVAAIPYRVSGAGPFGGELLVRLLSALLFGVTVAGVLLFLRELLPGTPRLAAVGALLVALLPQAAFISGSVNPDALLFALSSLLLWRLARAFRRGLTVRDGVLLGLLLAGASVSKLAGLMLVPGVAIAVLVLLLRRRRGDASVSLPGLGALVAAFAAPFLLYELVVTVFWAQSATGGGAAGTLGTGSVQEELSYTWQFFLPHLPSMSPMFATSPLQDVYLLQLVGSFGWNDTRYLPWVYEWGRPLLIGIAVVAVVSLATRHRALRARFGELVAYVAILGAFLVLIGHLGYRYREDLGLTAATGGFEQVRYLFPLLGLYAAMAVVALRLLGRRFAPHVAIVLVAIAALHSSAGVLTMLGRFYG